MKLAEAEYLAKLLHSSDDRGRPTVESFSEVLYKWSQQKKLCPMISPLQPSHSDNHGLLKCSRDPNEPKECALIRRLKRVRRLWDKRPGDGFSKATCPDRQTPNRREVISHSVDLEKPQSRRTQQRSRPKQQHSTEDESSDSQSNAFLDDDDDVVVIVQRHTGRPTKCQCGFEDCTDKIQAKDYKLTKVDVTSMGAPCKQASPATCNFPILFPLSLY